MALPKGTSLKELQPIMAVHPTNQNKEQQQHQQQQPQQQAQQQQQQQHVASGTLGTIQQPPSQYQKSSPPHESTISKNAMPFGGVYGNVAQVSQQPYLQQMPQQQPQNQQLQQQQQQQQRQQQLQRQQFQQQQQQNMTHQQLQQPSQQRIQTQQLQQQNMNQMKRTALPESYQHARPQPTRTNSSSLSSGNPPTQGHRLSKLLKDIDPRFEFDAKSEELILLIAEDFIDKVTRPACMLAKHRGSASLDVKDIALILDRQWGIRVPGVPQTMSRTPPYSRPSPANPLVVASSTSTASSSSATSTAVTNTTNKKNKAQKNADEAPSKKSKH